MNTSTPAPTYFLDCDEDGHWYLIPTDFRHGWNEWVNLPYDEDNPAKLPASVVCLDGGPHRVSFSHPIIS